MKKEIHPDYVEATVTCSCGNIFQTRSTKPELHVEICSQCHPFYSGKQKLVDSGGRVERFERRYGNMRPQRKKGAGERGRKAETRVVTSEEVAEAAEEETVKAEETAEITEEEVAKAEENVEAAEEEVAKAEETVEATEEDAETTEEEAAKAEENVEATKEEADETEEQE
jgi:large subunit ribosomal protein L31